MLELKKADELISLMKDKNIKFEKISDSDAIEFLENNTYYKKISSYQKNFHTYIKDDKKYFSNLDFAYLCELSTIDMHLRFLIFKMCVNIEHSVKVQIINKCIEKSYNGYDIIDEFFNLNSKTKDSILKNASNSYCTELIMKHQNHFPLWVVLEVISFGDLCYLYKFLASKAYFDTNNSEILFQVHNLRNAVAHNHCLTHNLQPDSNVRPNRLISQFVAPIKEITDTERRNRLSTRFICDFVTMLYAYDYFVGSEGMKKAAYDEIDNLFNDRLLRHKDYFSSCISVKNAYIFLKKIIDFYL